MSGISKWVCGAACGAALLAYQAPPALAAEAYPVIKNTQPGPQAFGVATAGSFGGIFTLNNNANFNGNQVLSINQNGVLACCHGATIEVSISNGENGVDETAGPPHPNPPPGVTTNIDIPNVEPVNSVFTTIGNPSGKLENGNVIRFSAWFRSDPANPITLDPQVQPILKIEYWKEALSGFADTDGVAAFPDRGDRIFDQDQQGSAFPIPDLPSWVDINGDGAVLDASATVGNGRVTSISTNEWRLVEVTHKVDSSYWLGIGSDAFGADDITSIESFKAVMFIGDFTNTDLTGDGADGGNLLIDNFLVEVFRNEASITPNLNPNPTLSEVTALFGDYNGNDVVDAADYTVWRNNLNTNFALPNRHPDNDGPVSTDDYDVWKANFGDTLEGGGSISGPAVPEPTSLVMATMLLAGCGLLRRKR